MKYHSTLATKHPMDLPAKKSESSRMPEPMKPTFPNLVHTDISTQMEIQWKFVT